MVFCNVPYGRTVKIGGLDGVSVPEFPVQGTKVSPSGAKTAIFFADFADFQQKR